MAVFQLFRSSALLAALAGVTLTACGPQAQDTEPAAAGQAQTAAPPLPEGATQPSFVAEHRARGKPYWITIAQQPGSLVQYAPQTIFRYPNGTAEIWLQIRHQSALTEAFEGEGFASEVTFNNERYRYVFDCQSRRFRVTERQIMGEGEVALRTISYETADGAPDWREIDPAGPARLLIGPACDST